MENKMREIRISKVVLSIAGTAEKLEKGVRLLKTISGMAPLKLKSHKRIPTFGVRPGLEVGCKATLRGEKAKALLTRLFQAVNNELKEKAIEENHFSFGIHEYIEIPGIEYQREIGIMGLNVTVDFLRTGKRVELRKFKRGKMHKKQKVSKEEIKDYMIKNFGVKII